MVAKRFTVPTGSWLLAEQLLESGDPAFVDELCRISDADKLGSFAKTWFADRRPASRRLLLEYLDRPLNHYRHEALVKRLLKLAQEKGDDEIMARFVVATDRSVRRQKITKHRYDWSSRQSWEEERIIAPRFTEMPRDDRAMHYSTAMMSPEQFSRLQLFSKRTRNYLRRRTWRYFRVIGKQDPARYIDGVSQTLINYTDADCVDGLALLDNWGLMHIMFHDSEVLIAKAVGWTLAESKSLGALKPAPAFLDAWKRSSEPLIKILTQSKCRPVRQWSIQMLRDHHPNALNNVPVETLLQWISNDDVELAQLAAESLKKSSDSSRITMSTWLKLLESANPQVLDLICEIMVEKTSPDALSLQDTVKLGCARPVPVARLGLKWLESKSASRAGDVATWLLLCEAQAEPVRPELVQLAWQKIAASPSYDPACVLELLDSRHIDVREIGWQWLTGEDKARDDTSIWQRLMETPYDDIHIKLAQLLKTYSDGDVAKKITQHQTVDPKLLRLLWASVLLNIHRGGRQKPAVVAAIVDRLEKHPEEAEELLPIMSVALRSVRSVEWRAGLSGVVRLAERRPDIQELIEKTFPELQLV